MNHHETFIDKFSRLLREFPANYTLEQWQYDYRQVMFLMGQEIISKFSTDAVGPQPRLSSGNQPQTQDGTGDPKGGHPSFINCGFISLPVFVLDMRSVKAPTDSH